AALRDSEARSSGRNSDNSGRNPEPFQTDSSPQYSTEQYSTEQKGNVAEIRPDVSRLCTILADLIEGNGSKRPPINKTWLNAARLLIDTDKRPLGEAIALMKWCQADSFWRANIMSM